MEQATSSDTDIAGWQNAFPPSAILLDDDARLDFEEACCPARVSACEISMISMACTAGTRFVPAVHSVWRYPTESQSETEPRLHIGSATLGQP